MRALADVLRDWEAVIGLEIHTELTALENKMFCDCRISHTDPPNTNVCPVCLGLPGALPVPNRRAIESIVMAGIALGCEIPRRSLFFRKHYFYPDMAKNFQTTQGPVAFCMRGSLDLTVSGEGARENPGDDVGRAPDGSYVRHVRIQRIHMEEDAAKMVHVGGLEGRIASATESLIDYNRCGTPLIELVTEPDLRTPEEARLFMEKLRQILLSLGISDCSLENGSMRCDGNVSVRRRGDTSFGVKCELKNVNSLKSLHDALAFEVCRQAEVLEGGGVVRQETRHFEVSCRRTRVMRVKETKDDYRMYPDPDLTPFDLTDDFVERCRKMVPELPDEKAARYVGEHDVRPREARLIAANPADARFFEEVLAAGPSSAQVAANVVVNLSPRELGATPAQVASLVGLLADDAVTFAQARELLELVAGTRDDPARVADERGMRQASDASVLAPIVDEVLARCSDQVRQYREGNTRVLGFFVGQCMKAAGGSGNPRIFGELLRHRLDG
jgi:aspartyl-tRNA(Asn)/glutamyl-tRNA(Gln) amidotransferase subunit B